MAYSKAPTPKSAKSYRIGSEGSSSLRRSVISNTAANEQLRRCVSPRARAVRNACTSRGRRRADGGSPAVHSPKSTASDRTIHRRNMFIFLQADVLGLPMNRTCNRQQEPQQAKKPQAWTTYKTQMEHNGDVQKLQINP